MGRILNTSTLKPMKKLLYSLFLMLLCVGFTSCGDDDDKDDDTSFGQPGDGSGSVPSDDERYDFSYYAHIINEYYILDKTGEWVVEFAYGFFEDIKSRGFDEFGVKLRSDNARLDSGSTDLSFGTWSGKSDASKTLFITPGSASAKSVTLKCKPYVWDNRTDRYVYFPETTVTVSRPKNHVSD